MKRLGLLGRFALASAAAMMLLGIVLAQSESSLIRSRALANARGAAMMLTDIARQSGLSPADLKHGISVSELDELDEVFIPGIQDHRIARVKIWSPDGTILYSDEHSLIGATFPIEPDLHEALDGEVSADVSSLEEAENVDERDFGRLLEVYIPVRFERGGKPVGAFELYLPYAPIAAAISSDTRRLYLITATGLLLLWGVVFNIVFGASRKLRRHAEEMRRHAEDNEYLALHDQLTDLPNRTLFRDRLAQSILSASRDGGCVGVMIMDLDRFKEVNEALGHDHGDLLLTEVGQRLRTALRGTDTVARLGGDEFGILITGLDDPGQIESVARKVAAALEQPFDVNGIALETVGSIGIAMYPNHGSDVDGLMRRADVAMYVAKAARVPFELYSAEQDLYTRERLTMVTELRRAIDGNRLQLHYQPVIDLAARRVVGVEALARWPHPDRGLVAADQFIPLAEHAGLIRKLTSHVLEAALSQARTWRDAGMPLIVAVNVSARDLMDPRLPEEVEAALHRHDLGAEYLELEITESSIMDQPARGEAVLGRLSAMGVALAIDDFGTGYSSLAYLQRLPVQRLKIDRSFVVRLATSDGDAAIVRSTVDLGRNLGLAVVAEGVEDEESLERLAGMGCDMVQGFHFARPMPPEDVIEWLRGSGFPLAEPRPLSSGATDDVAKAS